MAMLGMSMTQGAVRYFPVRLFDSDCFANRVRMYTLCNIRCLCACVGVRICAMSSNKRPREAPASDPSGACACVCVLIMCVL